MTDHLHRVLLLCTRLAINALALVVVDALFGGVRLDNSTTTVVAAVVLALVNTYLRPLLVILTLPLTILTVGLFTLVINALLLLFVSWLVPAFHVAGFGTAFGAALVISLISFLLNCFLYPGRVQLRVRRLP